MKNLKSLLSPTLVLLAAACSNMSAPIVEEVYEPEMRSELNHLKWQSPAGPDRFSAVSITGEGEVELRGTPFAIATDGTTVPLSRYQVSFWAEYDEDETVRIYYASGTGYNHPFLEFELDEESLYRRPDGTLFEDDDEVLITITIDPENMAVHLEPSGLQFDPSEPAELRMWYSHANPDYNGDGAVNSTDAALEAEFELWVQQEIDDPWYSLNSTRSMNENWVESKLLHFSGYAVSW